MIDVGFCTGSLYKMEIPLDKILDFYKDVGATAVELGFGTVEDFERFKLTEKLINKINTFNFISIHTPFRNIRYNSNNETKKVLKKLNYLNKNLDVKGIVIHPDIVDDFHMLKDSGLPFLIENMNLEKNSGKFACEFRKYDEFNLGYVLDVEHVYGNDKTKALANELIEVMGSRLHHLHVSGKKDKQRHVLAHLSENKSKIWEILKSCQVSRISEGILPALDYDLASIEIKYLNQF